MGRVKIFGSSQTPLITQFDTQASIPTSSRWMLGSLGCMTINTLWKRFFPKKEEKLKNACFVFRKNGKAGSNRKETRMSEVEKWAR